MNAAVFVAIILSLVAIFGETLLLEWFDRQDTRRWRVTRPHGARHMR